MIYKIPFLLFIFLLFIGCEKENFYWNLPKKPVVVTYNEMVFSPSDMALIVKGEVLKDEGSPVTQRGLVWSNSDNPTLKDNFTSNGTGTGIFTGNITGLVENATYYIRTYATNSIGTSYGEARIFIVPSKTPSVSTTIPSSITSNSALCGGNVSFEGESPVTQRGVVWSNSPNPTLSDNFTSNGTGSGMFSSSITGLSASTKYYIRAYATNSFGTSFGNQIEIQTMDPVSIVSTTGPSNITSNSALCGGNVTFEGESPVTQRGVVWSNSPNPTLSDNFTSNGTGSGLFSSSITVLSASTNYYIRAYATNSFGTSYGNQIEIQTMDPVPVLISTNPCNSLIGISSSFTHWHSSSYDFHPWSVATSGYIGNCFISDGNFLGADAKSGYIEFPITMNGSGFLSFWIRSGTSGTWHGANRIPGIYIDGVQISTPTVIGGQSEFNWQKIKTSTISEGNHLLKIQFFENGAAEDILKVDEIEIWEYQ
jgi:hypothetical protein